MWNMRHFYNKGQWHLVNVVIDVMENGFPAEPGEPPIRSASVGHPHARGPSSYLLRFRSSVQSHSDRCMVATDRETDLKTMRQCIKIIFQVAKWDDGTIYFEPNSLCGGYED